MASIPLDLLDRIRALEDRLRAVEGRTQQRPAQNQILGNVDVGAGGVFRVLDTDGSVIIWVGGIAPAHPDGSPQRGALFYREDGSLALQIATTSADPQGIAVRDREGNFLLSDDVLSGSGLARPYLSTDAWVGATAAPTDTTTSGTFTTLQNMPGWNRQHPKITANYLVQTAAGVTGEIQLIDDSSNVIIPPQSIAANSFYYGAATGSIPGAFGSITALHWQARVTGGAGTIGVRGLATYGVQS